MFSLMGNCISSCKRTKGPEMEVTLGVLGLDNAGKTVLAKALSGESPIDVAPTVGFSTTTIQYKKHSITLFDLGGSSSFRTVWKNYVAEMYGIVYLVDSTDKERVDECRTVLTDLLNDPLVSGKPILLLANKQDVEGAMDEIDICEQLGLEELVNQNRCPCRVETCSATLGYGKKTDPAIKQGVEWLMGTISKNYDKYSIRVTEDVKVQRAREAQEKREKTERVRRIREEREKKEKEERRLRGEPEPDSDDGMDMVDGDPFKKLDLNELSKKDAQLKEEKRKQKEAQARLQGLDLDEGVRKSRSHSTSSARSAKTSRSASPRPGDLDTFHTSPQLSRRFYAPKREVTSDDELPRDNLSSSWYKPKGSSLDPLPAMASPRPLRSKGSLDDMELRPMGRRNLAPLSPLTKLEPLPALAAKDKKKKKKKPKRNQTVPSPEHHGSENGSVYIRGSSSDTALGWKTLPGQSSLSTRVSKSPTLQTLEESDSQNGGLAARYGLMDDVFSLQPAQRTRPNADSDYEVMT